MSMNADDASNASKASLFSLFSRAQRAARERHHLQAVDDEQQGGRWARAARDGHISFFSRACKRE